MPPAPSCVCGTCVKCKNREANRRFWASKSPTERQAIVARRNAELTRATDRARHHVRKTDPTYQMKRKAREMIYRAVRSGLLSRGPCENCGNPDTQGHHDDYSRPLDVRWLCSTCHTAVHV